MGTVVHLRRRMALRSLAVCTLLFSACGCGQVPPVSEPGAPEAAQLLSDQQVQESLSVADDADATGSVTTQGPLAGSLAGSLAGPMAEPETVDLVVEPNLSDLFEVADVGSIGVPEDFPAIDDSLVPQLIAAELEQFLLDVLAPVRHPSSGYLPANNAPTFLELMCREQGEADFICRQRYG